MVLESKKSFLFDFKVAGYDLMLLQPNLALINFFEKPTNVYYQQVFTIYHGIYAMIANFGKQEKVY